MRAANDRNFSLLRAGAQRAARRFMQLKSIRTGSTVRDVSLDVNRHRGAAL